MRLRRTMTGGIIGLTGLGIGLAAGSAVAAWLLRSPSPAPAGGHADQALADATCEQEYQRQQEHERQQTQPILPTRATSHTEPPLLESLSPRPRTRVMQLAVVLLVAGVVATVASLVGAAHVTTSQHRKMAIAMTGGDPAKGQSAITTYGCSSCHTIPGIHGARAQVGPPLTQIGGRSYIGGVLANTPENLIRWIQNAPGVDPRTAMPNVGVTESDARDIAAYLYTLR